MIDNEPEVTVIDDTDTCTFERLPGLFRAWDLPFLLQPGADYRLDAFGPTHDGTPLYCIYCRIPQSDHATTGDST